MPLKKFNQDGFSLLEVLIAVVVVSVGFLATARMQIEGLRSSQSAYYSSQATFMMRDVADRMRANPEGIALGYYKTIETGEGENIWPACMNNETECSAAEIAQADKASMNRYLYPPPNAVGFRPALPSSDDIPAKGTVSFDASNDTYTISVFWSERVRNTDTEQAISMKVFP